ncbi:uncharacterized protein LOC121838470 [Ixodes scapularis]|uniref:uncharacterized protein LOC121838470 n=1 Tax=Ixodes scapularis TaxID=6945 RepID=UPI001C38AEFE|nr:uncharacterized protein LOC121838470 [Ixodes scapularis]
MSRAYEDRHFARFSYDARRPCTSYGHRSARFVEHDRNRRLWYWPTIVSPGIRSAYSESLLGHRSQIIPGPLVEVEPRDPDHGRSALETNYSPDVLVAWCRFRQNNKLMGEVLGRAMVEATDSQDWTETLELRKQQVAVLEGKLATIRQEERQLAEDLASQKQRYLDEAQAFQTRLITCRSQEKLVQLARKAKLPHKRSSKPNVCKTAFRLRCAPEPNAVETNKGPC